MEQFERNNQGKTKKERNSSIELLKLFAMVLIVFSHARSNANAKVDWYMDLDLATTSIQRFLLVLLYYGGQLGDAVFITCSSWFLLENDHVRPQKIFYMIGDCFVISVLILLAFLAGGFPLSKETIIQQFMPTYLSATWFIPCYLLLYLIHPALNMLLRSLGKERLLAADLGMGFLYCGLNVLKRGTFFYSRLIGFITIYFIVAYVKRYLKKSLQSDRINWAIFFGAAAANLGLLLLTNFLGLHTEFFRDKLCRWRTFMNPFFLLMAVSLLNLARKRTFVSKKINFLSSLSLLFYVIHDNALVWKYGTVAFFGYFYRGYSFRYELAWVLLLGVLLLSGGLFLAILYRMVLQRAVHSVCDAAYRYLQKGYRALLKYLLKFE